MFYTLLYDWVVGEFFLNYIYTIGGNMKQRRLWVGLGLVFHGVTAKILLSKTRKMANPISSNMETFDAKSLSPLCMVSLKSFNTSMNI